MGEMHFHVYNRFVYTLSADADSLDFRPNQDAQKWEVIHMWRLDTPHMLEKHMTLPESSGY